MVTVQLSSALLVMLTLQRTCMFGNALSVSNTCEPPPSGSTVLGLKPYSPPNAPSAVALPQPPGRRFLASQIARPSWLILYARVLPKKKGRAGCVKA